MFLFLCNDDLIAWWGYIYHCFAALLGLNFLRLAVEMILMLNYSVGFWNVKVCLYHSICMYSCKLVIKKPQGKYILSIEKLVFMWLECFFKFLSQRETHVSYFVYLLIWYVPASLQFQNTFTISIKIDFYRIVNSLSSCDIVSTLFSCFLFQGSQKPP